MKFCKAIAMEMPNGSQIELEQTAGRMIEDDAAWESLNLNMTRADGYRHTIAALDFDEGTGELMIHVYDEEKEAPVFSKIVLY